MNLSRMIRAQVADQKAIPAHPALMMPDPALTYRLDDPAKRKPFGQREAHRHLQAYGGTESIDWLMDCLRLISETGGGAEYHFAKEGERLVTERTPTTPKEMKDAPLMLARLFDKPNPYMPYEELIELTLIDYILVGNAYWLKYQMNGEGQPLALYRLSPALIKVVPGPFGIERYEYQVPGQKDPTKFQPEEIVHFKMANPHSPYFGLGIIKGGARMLDLEIALTDTQASYFEKHAMPSMVVQSERRVPKDVFDKLKRQIRQQYSGSRNAGNLMLLEAGLKYQSIAPSATEAAFKELTDQSRERIFALCRVPPALLGVTTSTEKINEAQRIFDTKTMRPLLNKLQKAISLGVTSAWGVDFVIDYEYVMPPEERLKLAGVIAGLPGIRVREIREAAGYEPTGDPEIDDMVLNLPGEDGTEENTRNGFPDRNLPGEAGRPPLPENTRQFSQTGAVAGGSSARRPSEGTKAVRNYANVKNISDILDRINSLPAIEGKAVESNIADKIEAPADPFRSQREREVDLIVADAARDIANAIHNLERSLLDHVEGKAWKPNDIKSRIRKSEAWKTFSAAVATALERAAKRAASASVMHQASLDNRANEEVDYDTLAREIVYRPAGLKAIMKNMQDKVIDHIRDAKDGPDAEKGVREVMEIWRNGHAASVALDTATEAYNEGTITIAESMGRRIAVIDGEDHDQPCKDAHGSIWEPNFARENRLEHPRCRRAFSILPE